MKKADVGVKLISNKRLLIMLNVKKEKMKTVILICHVWALLVLAGCNLLTTQLPDQNFETPQTAVSLTPTTFLNLPTLTQSIIPTRTLTPSPSSDSSIIKTPAGSPANILFAIYEKKCLAENQERSDRLHGNLITLVGPNSQAIASIYDLTNGRTQKISQNKIKNVVISPDKVKYAIQEKPENNIKIFSVDGKLLSNFLLETEPWYLSEWLDDEHLLFVVDQPIAGTEYEEYPRDIVIVNPTTNEQKRYKSDYPNIDQVNTNLMWEGGYTTAYEPSLSRVIYAASIEKDYIGDHGQGYVLWDLVNKEKVLQIVTGQFGATPKWSPDGSRFVVSHWWSGGLFYLVTRTGGVTKVIIPEFENASEAMKYSTNLYSWSPDGRNIAFWLEGIDTHEDNEATLVILDTITGEMTDTCITAGNVGPWLIDSYVPVWSPDGEKIVTIANRKNDGTFDTVIVDYKEGNVLKIGQSMVPQGWVDFPVRSNAEGE